MVVVTVSDMRQIAPNAGIKVVVIRTDANAATGYTIDASTAANGGFADVYATYCCDDLGAVKVATFSALAITLGTISTGIHTVIIWGV